MKPSTELTGAQRDAVLTLVAAAQAHDSVAPLNEEAHLQLDHADALHWQALTEDGTLAGYAQWLPGHATGQLVVHPDHRRRGHGSWLIAAMSTHVDQPAVWAFGNLPEAQAFAEAVGGVPARGLHIMERELGDVSDVMAPDGIRLRGFTDADAEAFLAVNAAAFAGHPEQGSFSAADLANRQAEDWWNPDGLILAEDADGVVGFHWTKRHDAATGEVYVLGVHPRASGRGLGKLLLTAGLDHLARGGNSRVILYVDADNAPAVTLYERSGFRVVHTDTLYRPTTD